MLFLHLLFIIMQKYASVSFSLPYYFIFTIWSGVVHHTHTHTHTNLEIALIYHSRAWTQHPSLHIKGQGTPLDTILRIRTHSHVIQSRLGNGKLFAFHKYGSGLGKGWVAGHCGQRCVQVFLILLPFET